MSPEERRKEATEKEAGTPGWMVTFSDLSTLLLTFFVLLLSMSTMDDLTLKSMFQNYTSSSGILYFKDYGEIYTPKEARRPRAPPSRRTTAGRRRSTANARPSR